MITIAIFSYYAIRPTVTTILSLQKSIDEQTSILNRLQEKVRSLSAGKQNYEGIDQDIRAKLANLIPNSPELPQLINSVNYIARQSEASISGVQFQTVKLENKKNLLNRDAPITPVDFTLIAQGSYANLMRLLTQIKRIDRLISITSINFAQPSDADLIMSVNARAYYLKN
ncbi:type 4a pilus biogenesis protein PilO [Candidatus Daviesbacteria bacterium]|nr:type 4a pilus biogenesis protein PilO [Candidatus Daviesbacteria bacterium]